MKGKERVRRILKVLDEKHWSMSLACRISGVPKEFIRNQKRNPNAAVNADHLASFARTAGYPLSYFTEDDDEIAAREQLTIIDPEIRALAEEIAERATRTTPKARRESVKAQIIPEIYDILVIRRREGETLDREQLLSFCAAVIRRMVLHRMRGA